MDWLAHSMVPDLALHRGGRAARAGGTMPHRAAVGRGLVSALYWRDPVQTASISAWLALDIASAILAAALVLRHACLPAQIWPWLAAGGDPERGRRGSWDGTVPRRHSARRTWAFTCAPSRASPGSTTAERPAANVDACLPSRQLPWPHPRSARGRTRAARCSGTRAVGAARE